MQHLRNLKQATSLFVGMLVSMSRGNFVISLVEHGKRFITSGTGVQGKYSTHVYMGLGVAKRDSNQSF